LKEFSKKLYFFLNLEIYFCIGRSEDFAASIFISGKNVFIQFRFPYFCLGANSIKKYFLTYKEAK
jgi:hypothetical protein